MTYNDEQTKLRYEQADRLDEYHEAYERAVKDVRGDLGGTFPLRIGGEEIETDETFTARNPGDRSEVVGEFALGQPEHVDRAVEVAQETFDGWRRTPYEERVEIFQEAADITRDRKFRLSAVISLENGKDRHEAVADVDEAIDFLDFYGTVLDEEDGFRDDTGRPNPNESTESVLRPYGVFGVVSPFNFPGAIMAGMTAGPTLVGNTAVVKPAEKAPAIAHEVVDILEEAGVPDGVVNLVTGTGTPTGQAVLDNEGIDGIVFTGSREVGMTARRKMAERNQPCVAELGGKNAVVVTDNAKVDWAVEGTCKGAFSFSGQKCSAASRAFVHQNVYDEFVDGLVSATKELEVGDQTERDTFVTPVIEERKVDEYREAIEAAEKAGATIEVGGSVLETGPYSDGFFVEPTVVTDLPDDHWIWTTELFLPVIAVTDYASFDEAITRVNETEYGLTGGVFTEDEDEWARFFDEAEVGVVYANRRTSATTGALVQAQPFVGWKMSGTTGKAAGGKHYIQQFLREQARTVFSQPHETRDPPATK
jgi:1-pyrroline-5-carboxylate dehydrogenase